MVNPQATCRLRIFLFLEALLKTTMNAAVPAAPEKPTIQAKPMPLEGIAAIKANKAFYNIVEVNHGR